MCPLVIILSNSYIYKYVLRFIFRDISYLNLANSQTGYIITTESAVCICTFHTMHCTQLTRRIMFSTIRRLENVQCFEKMRGFKRTTETSESLNVIYISDRPDGKRRRRPTNSTLFGTAEIVDLLFEVSYKRVGHISYSRTIFSIHSITICAGIRICILVIKRPKYTICV